VDGGSTEEADAAAALINVHDLASLDLDGVGEQLLSIARRFAVGRARGDGDYQPYEIRLGPLTEDYPFIGFTTNFAFCPTDALPPNHVEMLMMAQAIISVVVVTGIAGGDITGPVGSG
jgi:hypothetical protein